jgi:hypothetical protein
LGDSRAVLCPPDSKDRLIPVQLTTDLKPDLPSEHPNFSSHSFLCMHMNTHLDCILHSCTFAIGELTRILNYKGRVFAIDDESDVSLTFSLLLNWMQVKD